MSALDSSLEDFRQFSKSAMQATQSYYPTAAPARGKRQRPLSSMQRAPHSTQPAALKQHSGFVAPRRVAQQLPERPSDLAARRTILGPGGPRRGASARPTTAGPRISRAVAAADPLTQHVQQLLCGGGKQTRPVSSSSSRPCSSAGSRPAEMSTTDQTTKFGRQPRPASALSTRHVSTWKSLTSEHTRSTEFASRLLNHGDELREAQVFVRPYSGRVTDYDMRPCAEVDYATEKHEADQSSEQRQQQEQHNKYMKDMSRLDRLGMSAQLRAPCTCMGCKLRELRCLEARGDGHQFYLKSKPLQLVVEPDLVMSKLRSFRKKSEREIRRAMSTRLQGWWRGISQRKAYQVRLQRHCAAIQIQRIAKGWLMKLWYYRVRFERTHATLEIQRIGRGRAGRRAACLKREAFTASVTKFQKIFRGGCGRFKWRKEHKTRSAASARIQAAWVGLHGRRSVSSRRRAFDKASKKIQGVWLGSKARKSVAQKRFIMTGGVMIIQRAVRSWLTRTYHIRRQNKRNKCALFVQNRWRVYKAHMVFARLIAEHKARHAIKIQKTGRMMLGRKRWQLLFKHWCATSIQKIYRAKVGRARHRALKMKRQNMLMMMTMRIKKYLSWVRKRSAARKKIQRVTRGMLGRRRFFYFLKVRATTLLQRFVRQAWARHKLKKFIRVLVQCQKFVKRMKPRIFNFRRHQLMHQEAIRLAETHMQELGKMLTLNQFWQGSVCSSHPHEERLRTTELLIKWKPTLRKLYLKYSLVLVSAPDKAFLMSRQQFSRFVKDSGIEKLVKKEAGEKIFNTALQEVVNGESVAAKASKDAVMLPAAFMQAVVMLAQEACRDVSTTRCQISCFLEKYCANMGSIDDSKPPMPGMDEPDSETHAVLAEYKRRLEKCFKFYGGANQPAMSAKTGGGGVEETDDDSIDCVEWMQLCRESAVIDANVSFSRVLEIFVRCNQEEVVDYLTAMPNPSELRDMSMEFDEFCEAVVATAYLRPPKKKSDPFSKQLDNFIELMLSNGTKKFM